MALGMDNAVGAVANLINTAVDKIWPNPEDKAKAECMLMTAQLESVKIQMSVMLAEASSTDPFTSRARPSFLYVVYTMLLFGLPMGILSAFNPEVAKGVAAGFNAWLAAIPSDLYELFKWVMLGYIGARSAEKVKGVTK